MVKSPYPDVEIPEVAVHHVLMQCMEMYSDRVFVVRSHSCCHSDMFSCTFIFSC